MSALRGSQAHILNISYAGKHFSSVSVHQLVRSSHILNTQQKFWFKKSSFVLSSRTYYGEGFFNYMSHTKPVIFAQEALINIHDFTGFPWWLSIILSTVCLRTLVTFPLTIYQHQVLAKYQNVASELENVNKEMKREAGILIKKYNYTEKQARLVYLTSLRNYRNKLIIRDNCHPMKSTFVMYFQIPVWITLSFALRGFSSMMPFNDAAAQIVFAQLSTGGFLWLSNLTIPDPYYILPLVLGIVNFANIELHSLRARGSKSKLQKVATNVFRGATLLMIPISMTVPSCLSMYWTVSSILGLGQNIILMHPRMRRAFGILKTPTEPTTPFADIRNNLKSRFGQ